MKASVEARCIVCRLVFCCKDCRWNHEKSSHGLTYDCPICRGFQYLCRPELLNQDFIDHITQEHLPLQCKKCDQLFKTMEDLTSIDKCTSISELVPKEEPVNKEVDAKFDSIYKRTINNEGSNVEGIILINKASKTAIITPVVRKKTLVDYESSDSEIDDRKPVMKTPHPKLVPKTPRLKRQRTSTPHVKKLMSLMRQKVVEEYEETIEEGGYDGSPINKQTPLRNEPGVVGETEMTTPTSHLPLLMKLAQTVTTSTPTHPQHNAVTGGWSLFPGQSADSPLSEIETAESPAQSIGNEPSKSESEAVPKLKSIIVTGSRNRIGSQDSSEKHVTFQDSETNEASTSKAKRVKFADDTVFEQPKVNRVFRKPKRMLTPGPQKPKFGYNPRFQALINRFENQGLIMARTPVNNRDKLQEHTPSVGEPSNLPARAINFKDESPIVEKDVSCSKDSNDSFKTCIDSSDPAINNAITALTANIAGSLQNCLSSAFQTTEEGTEIQFKFVITKKKVSYRRMIEEIDHKDEKLSINERHVDPNKENIWSSVAKAVKSVFWGDQSVNFATTTPHRSFDSTATSCSTSGSKRKCSDMSDCELSPLNHKRHKYSGRIRARPPLRRSKTWVSSLRSSMSAENSLIKEALNPDDNMNLSF